MSEEEKGAILGVLRALSRSIASLQPYDDYRGLDPAEREIEHLEELWRVESPNQGGENAG